ncbi:M12 family metallopeptidase [Chitinimonas sp. PSY-7]|uniref:M12 family metallopeptidase n=1 Tax=Chitinimonas sp. PSY-7 TaxID=3459088 RepID=UPI00403FE30F
MLTNASPKTRQLFLEAAKEISRNSALRFMERTDEQEFIYLVDTPHDEVDCSTFIGRGTNAITLTLGCQHPSIVLHELMHVVGFAHEDQRLDRDQYVTADDSNPILGKVSNALHVGPYDLDSVMHHTFGKDLSLKNPTAKVRAWPRDTLSKGDIAALEALYGGVPKNTGPMPTDNGLSVVVSKRRLVLAQNTTGEVGLQILPAVQLSIEPQIKTSNDFIKVNSIRDGGNNFKLSIRTEPYGGGTSKIFFHFRTTDGKAGTAVIDVEIVKPQELPQSFRQLVSAWKPIGSNQKQCLEARQQVSYGERFPNPLKVEEEEFIAFLRDTPMSAVLAPCDSNKSLQLWKQDELGRLLSSTDMHCLTLAEPLTNNATDSAHIKITNECNQDQPPATAKWLYEDGKLINAAYPRSALSYTAGEVPALFPKENRQVPWQQWIWY